MPLGYLDGNTGSLLATLLVGGTAGAAVAARSARARVSGAFGRKKKGDEAPADTPVTAATADPGAGTDASAAPGPDEAASPAGPPEAPPGA